jgi:exonuclease SbcC
MIPQRLVLKNFLSYRQATLDFRGLHTACICGANGSGKSSLLEAIAWAIWGESRATSEDDVIHLGEAEAQVDFIFIHQQHTYRIIRSRQRGQGSTLEFQVARGVGSREQGVGSREQGVGTREQEGNEKFDFRSLTGKGVRATQQVILEHLKLDYETFVNSAYLRQGRADEFMLKRPGERKQILADLLKLNQYDHLAERAKDIARQLKGQMDLLERNLEAMERQLQQREAIAAEQSTLEITLEHLQLQQLADTEQWQAWQASQQQRQLWQQQLTWQQQQQQVLEQDCQRSQQELTSAQQQQQELVNLLQQSEAIAAGYAQFQALQAQEEQLATQFKTHQQIQTQRQQSQQQYAERIAQLHTQQQQIQAQLEALQQQEQENQQILSKAPKVEAALKELQKARIALHAMDQLQLQVAPLTQRRDHLQQELDRGKTRLTAHLEEIRASFQELYLKQQRHPHLQQAVVEVSDRITDLEQQRIYQQQVRDKGLERRNFMERLQESQRNYETQLSEVEQKIQWLKQPMNPSAADSEVLAYPPCPLCDRPLDEHHWDLVLEKHQTQHQEILEQIWVIREQLAASEREIQILRQEYRALDRSLSHYAPMLEQRGQLQEQLQTSVGMQQTLQQLTTKASEIEQTLQTCSYAADLQEELQLLEQRLQQCNYDEKNHALARGDVDRWRWAEMKQAEMKQAQRRQTQLAQRQPELHRQLTELQTQQKQLQQAAEKRLAEIDQHLAQIGYDLEQHNALRAALRQAQPWQLHYQELCQAQQTYPQVQQRVNQLLYRSQERQHQLQEIRIQVQSLQHQLQQCPDYQTQIQTLERQLQQQRSDLDEKLALLGRLQQQQQHLETLYTQSSELKIQLQTTQHQHKIYHELAQAFGKNGIQALMIENLLPQFEAETNRILGRLSANQLHIQFITQRSRENPKSKIQNPKLIETLDILIADARGTRPYETYSGGEAFRVNFAIRLALARLLAQRSGTALQMLIVDEGFGSQDAEGCDRLIAAINAIAPDFACILTVTHVPHFKEAFQARIEVSKLENGSHLELIL